MLVVLLRSNNKPKCGIKLLPIPSWSDMFTVAVSVLHRRHIGSFTVPGYDIDCFWLSTTPTPTSHPTSSHLPMVEFRKYVAAFIKYIISLAIKCDHFSYCIAEIYCERKYLQIYCISSQQK